MKAEAYAATYQGVRVVMDTDERPMLGRVVKISMDELAAMFPESPPPERETAGAIVKALSEELTAAAMRLGRDVSGLAAYQQEILAAYGPERPTATTIMRFRDGGKSRFNEIVSRMLEARRAEQRMRMEHLRRLVTFLSDGAKPHNRPASMRTNLVSAAYSFGLVLEPMNLNGLPVQLHEFPLTHDERIPHGLVAIFDRDQRMIGAFRYANR